MLRWLLIAAVCACVVFTAYLLGVALRDAYAAF